MKEKDLVSKYLILDDSGVDYAFLGYTGPSWVGQIVEGCPTRFENCTLQDYLTLEKPFGLGGTWSSDAKNFKKIEEK